MNNSASLNQVSREDLHYLLPKSLREILDGKESNFSSPETLKNRTEVDSNLASPEMTPSPQIPPLESRLHCYLLKKSTFDETAKPCNLSQFFNDKSINDEIHLALREIPQRVKIFDHLEDLNFFGVVKRDILEYQKSVKKRLDAKAVSFVPEWNKENVNLNVKLSNRY